MPFAWVWAFKMGITISLFFIRWPSQNTIPADPLLSISSCIASISGNIQLLAQICAAHVMLNFNSNIYFNSNNVALCKVY